MDFVAMNHYELTESLSMNGATNKLALPILEKTFVSFAASILATHP